MFFKNNFFHLLSTDSFTDRSQSVRFTVRCHVCKTPLEFETPKGGDDHTDHSTDILGGLWIGADVILDKQRRWSNSKTLTRHVEGERINSLHFLQWFPIEPRCRTQEGMLMGSFSSFVFLFIYLKWNTNHEPDSMQKTFHFLSYSN